MQLFGDGASPEDFATLEHQWRKAGLCQVRSRDQPVVSRADDDDPVAGGGHYAWPRLESLSIFLAALSPGAPMMPPPGCTAEPHMYRPRIGVR